MLSNAKLFVKKSYVTVMHGLGRFLRSLGVLGWLEKRLEHRGAHWFRSLFAIYDVDQMIALDVPWWTYHSIERVDTFLKAQPEAKVFEYGSGASSAWLARRAASVHSIEHDKGWFELMQSRIAGIDNLVLEYIPVDAELSKNSLYFSQKEGYEDQSFEAYANAIGRSEDSFDLIVIDGRARTACLEAARTHLAPGGLIVFDNTGRARYEAAIQKTDLSALPLPGLTPSLPYPDKTTLLQTQSFD